MLRKNALKDEHFAEVIDINTVIDSSNYDECFEIGIYSLINKDISVKPNAITCT